MSKQTGVVNMREASLREKKSSASESPVNSLQTIPRGSNLDFQSSYLSLHKALIGATVKHAVNSAESKLLFLLHLLIGCFSAHT